MDKELEAIAQVTSTGELRGKLLEADEAKVEIEAILLKRVNLGSLPNHIDCFKIRLHLMASISFAFKSIRTHYYKKRLRNGNNVKRNSKIFASG